MNKSFVGKFPLIIWYPLEPFFFFLSWCPCPLFSFSVGYVKNGVDAGCCMLDVEHGIGMVCMVCSVLDGIWINELDYWICSPLFFFFFFFFYSLFHISDFVLHYYSLSFSLVFSYAIITIWQSRAWAYIYSLLISNTVCLLSKYS